MTLFILFIDIYDYIIINSQIIIIYSQNSRMKLNASKTKTMIVLRFCSIHPFTPNASRQLC